VIDAVFDLFGIEEVEIIGAIRPPGVITNRNNLFQVFDTEDIVQRIFNGVTPASAHVGEVLNQNHTLGPQRGQGEEQHQGHRNECGIAHCVPPLSVADSKQLLNILSFP
jgi:hypothetical protein